MGRKKVMIETNEDVQKDSTATFMGYEYTPVDESTLNDKKFTGEMPSIDFDSGHDRFDFEEQLLQCWNIVDDLQIVFENVVETDMTRDDIANVLLGLKNLYQMKFQKTLDSFEHLVIRGEIL